jgi:aspartate aminotransferase
MARVSRRLAGISESATLAVEAKARAARAAGRDVIGFGAGEPDFPTPGHIVEAAVRACADPRMQHYTPTPGLPELREAVAAVTARDSGVEVPPGQVLVTNGGKQAVFQALAALVDPAEEVLLPAPYWTTYPEAVRLAGGIPVPVPSDERAGYLVDPDRLEAARTDRTKALVFCSPNNPSGAVHPPELVAAIGAWAARNGVWVISDEIYQHLVYGAARFVSLPAVSPELGDRWVLVNGVAKTYAMTGWRVGWLVGPPDVVAAAANLQSHSTSNVANVSQAAALAALTGPREPTERMRTAFDRRRRTMLRLLAEIPGVACPEPAGAFYCFPAVAGLLGRDLHGRRPASSAELAEVLLDEAGVAVVPGEAFGAPGYLRLSYALGDDDLVEGLTRIAKLVAAAG